MTLLNDIKKVYNARVKCTNCNEVISVNIPKGTTIEEWCEDKIGKCNNCGCTTIQPYSAKKEKIEKWKM